MKKETEQLLRTIIREELINMITEHALNEAKLGSSKIIEETAALGSGARFKSVEKSAAKSGASNPAAIASKAMWDKYGKKKGAALIKKGKQNENKEGDK